MKNLLKGKKLDKNQLKTINGGMLDCMYRPVMCLNDPCNSGPQPDANGCMQISPSCGQKICRPQ